MSAFFSALDRRQAGGRNRRTEWTSEEVLRRVANERLKRRCILPSNASLCVGCLAFISLTFSPYTHGESRDEVIAEESPISIQESREQQNAHPNAISSALVEQLRQKWHAQAITNSKHSQLSEDHLALLVDATSRANWTPLCSYTEESIGPDERAPQTRHRAFELDQSEIEQLFEYEVESRTDIERETKSVDSIRSEFDMLAGLRKLLAIAKVADSSKETVTYEYPVPKELFADYETEEDWERGMVEKFTEGIRFHFVVDMKLRGPKELRIGLLKPIRVFPGVKIKKMIQSTKFRYLEEVQEFAVDQTTMEMSARAFVLAGFSQRESKTLSDFRCIQKGGHETSDATVSR